MSVEGVTRDGEVVFGNSNFSGVRQHELLRQFTSKSHELARNWRIGWPAAAGVRQFTPFLTEKGCFELAHPFSSRRASRPTARIGAELARNWRTLDEGRMAFTTADLARHAGIAAVEDQTPPELIASSRLMVQALMSGVPLAMLLEHLIGSALAVLQLMPDPQAEAGNLIVVLTEELERLELLP